MARALRLSYRLVSFRGIFQIILFVFVQTEPDHDIQFGLNSPSFRSVTTLARKLDR